MMISYQELVRTFLKQNLSTLSNDIGHDWPENK